MYILPTTYNTNLNLKTPRYIVLEPYIVLKYYYLMFGSSTALHKENF